MRVLVAEREPEPGADQVVVVRGHQRVVRGAALVDPAGGGRGVQVADVLGLLDRVSGGLDPDVLAPGPARLGGAEQVADDPAVADRHRAGRVVAREERGDLGLARGGVLEPLGEQGLVEPVPAVPLGEQPAGVGQVALVEREQLEAGHAARLATAPRGRHPK